MSYKALVKARIGEDKELLYQIAGACLSCATDIENEDVGTENHANRIVWADRVKVNPLVEARNFLIPVCENATIAAALPDAVDGDVKYVVASNINTYATGE